MKNLVKKIRWYINNPVRNWLVHIYKYNANNRDGFLQANRISYSRYKECERKWDFLISKIYERSMALKCSGFARPNNRNLLTDFDIVSKVSGDNYGIVLKKSGKFYRAIREKRENDFIELWNSGLLQALMEYDLIPSIRVTDYYIEGFSVIVEVEKIDIISPEIWTMSILLESALCISLIREVAKRRGFFLIDGHTNNVGFKNGSLVLFDIGSIDNEKIINKFGGRDINCGKEVVMTCCYRLIFSMIGNMALSRWQVYDECNNGIRVIPFHREDTNREFILALKIFKKFHIRSGIRYRWILHKVFDEFDIKPFFIELLFEIKESGLRKPPYCDRNYLQWVELLKRNSVVVDFVGEMGGACGKICENIIKNKMAARGAVYEYNERYAEYSVKSIKQNGGDINVYLFNYLYSIREDILNSIQPDIAVLVDANNNNNYMPLFCDLDLMLYRLSLSTKRYVLCSFNEGEIISIFEKKHITIIDFENAARKRFIIIDKEKDNESDETIYLMKKCEIE